MDQVSRQVESSFLTVEGSIEQGIATNAEKDAGEGVDPLNRILDGATLVPEMKKPFDVLAEGLVSKISRGDKTAIELFVAGIRAWKLAFRPIVARELDRTD